MAHASSPVENPVSADAFTADRQKMFNGFCSATVFAIAAAVIILVLMALFLL
jgi:sterol desaturase/sphingolipid hydroxylase (fatty acid hydroxylase superfamily)